VLHWLDWKCEKVTKGLFVCKFVTRTIYFCVGTAVPHKVALEEKPKSEILDLVNAKFGVEVKEAQILVSSESMSHFQRVSKRGGS
jgi:hypothetical protein